MAFQNKNMSVIAYASGFTLWHYVSDDTIDQMQKKYFPKGFINLCANGDIIMINAKDGVAIRCIELTADDMILKPLK